MHPNYIQTECSLSDVPEENKNKIIQQWKVKEHEFLSQILH